MLILACNLLALASASLACYLSSFSSFVCFCVFLLAFFFTILLALAAGFLLSSAFPLASCLFLPLLGLHANTLVLPLHEIASLVRSPALPLVPWGLRIMRLGTDSLQKLRLFRWNRDSPEDPWRGPHVGSMRFVRVVHASCGPCTLNPHALGNLALLFAKK